MQLVVAFVGCRIFLCLRHSSAILQKYFHCVCLRFWDIVCQSWYL